MAGRKKKKAKVMTRDIPYVRCYAEGGMIETAEGIFTRCYEIMPPRFQKEITYSGKRVRERLKEIFRALSDYDFQFVIRNRPTKKEDYLKKIQLPHGKSDQINGCIDLYNELLIENVDVGHNNFERRVYLVISIASHMADEALERFEELDQQIREAFEALYGYVAVPLSLEERLEGLYGIYHPGMPGDEGEDPSSPSGDGSLGMTDGSGRMTGKDAFGMAGGEISFSSMKKLKRSTKEMIGAEDVFYHRTFMQVGGRYVRMLFINSVPARLPDSLFCDLTAISGDCILSASYQPMEGNVGYGAAKRMVDANTDVRTIDIRETVEDRRSKRTETIRSAIRESEEEYFYLTAKEEMEGACSEGTPMFLCNFVIALIAEGQEELERDTSLLKLSASKYACQIRVCDHMQKEAFQSVLPLNNTRVDYGRVFSLEKMSRVSPVDAQNLFEQRPMFQGLNQINDNFIFADRRNCPIGLIAGVEKSGKTFAVKRDVMNTLVTSEDKVFILTKQPEEYLQFMNVVGGTMNYIQPDPLVKDRDYALMDDAGVFQKLYLETVMTMASGYYRSKLMAEEKEERKKKISGEAEMLSYLRFLCLADAVEYARERPDAFPMFLGAFGKRAVAEHESFRRVNLIACIDDVDLLLSLDYLWNFAIGEKKENRNIWIYMEGCDEFLYSEAVSDYLLSLMDKAQKLRVPMTFVLDDSVHVVTDQDASIEFDYFLNRVQFFKLMSQGPIERKRYEERLNISSTLMPYITDREPGEGILITPSLNAAFTDRFERDSDFYGLFA